MDKLITLRHPTAAECRDPSLMPRGLRDWGFPYLDSEWSWVVEYEGVSIALILTSFAGGLLVFWRVLATTTAKRVCSTWFMSAIPRILDNAKLRGCVGYLSLFEDTHSSETKLARLVAKTGGVLRPFSGTLGVGVISGRTDA